jgi:hypothetical protein
MNYQDWRGYTVRYELSIGGLVTAKVYNGRGRRMIGWEATGISKEDIWPKIKRVIDNRLGGL